MLFSKKSKILVVVAHPDDEVFGCGGTLAKAIIKGAKVKVLFLGEGVSARFKENEIKNSKYNKATSKRKINSKKALEILGIKDYHYGDRLCLKFDQVPYLEFVKEIENSINNFKPNIIFTHHFDDVNIDHNITYKAVEAASRPIAKNLIDIYSFEIICSTNFKLKNTFKPNIYVDIKDTFNIKIKACKAFEIELRQFPFPRSIKGLKALAEYRGLSSGLEKAEAFILLRKIIS